MRMISNVSNSILDVKKHHQDDGNKQNGFGENRRKGKELGEDMLATIKYDLESKVDDEECQSKEGRKKDKVPRSKTINAEVDVVVQRKIWLL